MPHRQSVTWTCFECCDLHKAQHSGWNSLKSFSVLLRTGQLRGLLWACVALCSSTAGGAMKMTKLPSLLHICKKGRVKELRHRWCTRPVNKIRLMPGMNRLGHGLCCHSTTLNGVRDLMLCVCFSIAAGFLEASWMMSLYEACLDLNSHEALPYSLWVSRWSETTFPPGPWCYIKGKATLKDTELSALHKLVQYVYCMMNSNPSGEKLQNVLRKEWSLKHAS